MRVCGECKKNEVEDGKGTVCPTCRPAVRKRRISPQEMLDRIDATLAGK